MENEFVTYEQSIRLKNWGYNIPSITGFSYPNSNNVLTQAILKQQAFRWFRQTHKLDVTFRFMDYGEDSKYTGYYFIIARGNNTLFIHGSDMKSLDYDKLELIAIDKLIEIMIQESVGITPKIN